MIDSRPDARRMDVELIVPLISSEVKGGKERNARPRFGARLDRIARTEFTQRAHDKEQNERAFLASFRSRCSERCQNVNRGRRAGDKSNLQRDTATPLSSPGSCPLFALISHRCNSSRARAQARTQAGTRIKGLKTRLIPARSRDDPSQ